MTTNGTAASADFRAYYDLEKYLFETVSPRFAKERFLSSFDFFCIVIWKANRAKTRIARRLVSSGRYPDLDAAARALTGAIAGASPLKEKLRVMIQEWGFLLPMASAILTVLYPGDFTVYDSRVCDVLGDFDWVGNRTNFDNLWDGYSKYVEAVKHAAPIGLTLRDKDRWLWGRSFYDELLKDIGEKFARTIPSDSDN